MITQDLSSQIITLFVQTALPSDAEMEWHVMNTCECLTLQLSLQPQRFPPQLSEMPWKNYLPVHFMQLHWSFSALS